MKRCGPDSLNSWVIAAACCFINMMLFGMARLSGLLFVASISRFNVSRAKASFPYTFVNFVRNISGPLVGFLGHRYGVRAVTTLGCILGAIGAGACFFAESIATITVCWGVILGLGYGLGNILLPVSINQHFDKQRATASGISFSGACLGSFVLPPIVEILIKTYGLTGSFLLLSGFILNCIPAALLLKKLSFDIKSKQITCDQGERQRVILDVNTNLYTTENTSQTLQAALKGQFEVTTETKTENEHQDRYDLKQIRDEKDKEVPAQTFLPSNSVLLKTSDTIEVGQIVGDSTCQRNESLLKDHCLDQSVNNEESKNNFRSSIVSCQNPFTVNKSQVMSSEYANLREALNISLIREAYLNYGYQTNMDDTTKAEHELDNTITPSKHIPDNMNAPPHIITKPSTYHSSQSDKTNLKFPTHNLRNHSNKPRNDSESTVRIAGFLPKEEKEIHSDTLKKNSSLTTKKSFLGSFSVILDPIFILLAITMSIYSYTFVSIVTIVVDFSRDLHIDITREKYILMVLSIGDFIGRVGLGWITDRGFMTTTGFAALCFACQGIATAAIVSSNGFAMLMIIITLYGLAEGGIMIILPIIIAQYIEPDKQTVAISSSHFLSGPLCLAIAPMIGYFRDDIGAYDFIFYEISILSAGGCLSMLLLPYIAKCLRSRYVAK